MRLTLKEVKSIVSEAIRDCWAGSHPEEMYEQELMDDPALKKKSVMVPDDIKHKIRRYFKAMGLSGKKKRAGSS